jgi:transglutaminase-like putative cysteine protease
MSAMISLAAHAGTPDANVSVGPPAAWVQVFNANTASHDDAKPDPSGARYTLADEQVRITPTGRESYAHYAEHVESAAALEHVANIEIGFNPAFQHLTIHSVDVIRNGVVVHKLDPRSINVLQRERDLEHLIYDGEKSASLFLKDVRIGDTVDYRYTRSGVNPVFANLASGSFELQWGVPIDEFRGRLVVANNHHVKLRQRNVKLEISESDSPGYHEYAWTEHAIKGLHVANDTPEFYDPYAALDYSEYSSWHEVAQWADGVFSQAAKPGPLTTAEVSRIAREYPDSTNRLLATLRFVQGQIRYLGVEIGPGSQAPNSPETVLTRRFGDCKDKALLAVTMLRAMGIHADPALVNPEMAETLIDQQPSPRYFSHAIVHVDLDGREFWLDPTWDAQSSDLEHVVQPRYGYALLLRPETRDLTQIAEQPSSTRKENVQVHIDSSAGLDKPVLMTVETTAEGVSAERTRRFLATHSKDEVQRDFLNYFKGYYSGVSVADPFTVDDAPQVNRIKTVESYRIADFWPAFGDKKHEASFYAMGLKRELHQTDEPVRTSPLSIGEKYDFTESTEVTLPRTFQFSADHDHISDAAFELDHRTENGDHKLRLSTRFTKSATFVAADRVEAYMANAEKAYNATRFYLYDQSATVDPAQSSLSLNISTWAPLWLLLTILFVIPIPGRVARALQATTLVDLAGPAPKHPQVESAAAGDAPNIWDPNSAAALSLLFSTAFGAFLVARNWTELGEPKRARQSYLIAFIELAMSLVQVGMQPDQEGVYYDLAASIALLIGWYLLDARPQAKRLGGMRHIERPFWPRVVCCGVLYAGALYLLDYLIKLTGLYSP